MREYFTNVDYQKMLEARQSIHDIILPIANTIESSIPSFDGFALFQQDYYHPDSAGAVVQVNATKTPPENLAFQRTHITNHRVDLNVSTLGNTFQDYKYKLAESRMNPEQHLVAGLYLPEEVGKRAAAVLQLAFTKQLGAPSADELQEIKNYWELVVDDVTPQLDSLHSHAQRFPNRSVADALQLDVPTTPNAFVINWDTSHSREQAVDNYGKLRYDLTRRGQAFLDIAERYSGTLMRPTGDGQSFALEIPADQYDRLSDDSIARFAAKSLLPLVRELAKEASSDGAAPVRIAVDLGRIEHTTFDMSSPALFTLADVSDMQPHTRVSVGFGQRAIEALQLTNEDIKALTA